MCVCGKCECPVCGSVSCGFLGSVCVLCLGDFELVLWGVSMYCVWESLV